MEYIVYWFCTVAATTGMAFGVVLDICKSIADKRYKLDMFKVVKDNAFITLLFLVSSLITSFNLVLILLITACYVNVKKIITSEIIISGFPTYMNTKEVEEYQNNPTGFNAFKIFIKGNYNKPKKNKFSNNSKTYPTNKIEDSKPSKSISLTKTQINTLEQFKKHLLLDEENIQKLKKFKI